MAYKLAFCFLAFVFSFLKLHFFLIFLTFSKYKYNLANFQQKFFKKKKLNKLFPNESYYNQSFFILFDFKYFSFNKETVCFIAASCKSIWESWVSWYTRR